MARTPAQANTPPATGAPRLSKLSAPEDGANASAPAFIKQHHAHPPAAGGQPLPALVQHQAFFATLHPTTQFAKPASQSNGGEVVPTVAHPPLGPPGQPLPWTLQHHSFLPTVQPLAQFSKPSAQL